MFAALIGVPNIGDLKNPVIPTSGDTLSVTIDASANNLVLWSYIDSLFSDAGNYGAFDITINSGVDLGATSTSYSGLDLGTGWPTGASVTINNYGRIFGKGGNGGTYSSSAPGNGENGGDAINCTVDCTINNYNVIGGGGGGGGGGTNTLEIQTRGTGLLTKSIEVQAYGGGGAGLLVGVTNPNISRNLLFLYKAPDATLFAGAVGYGNAGDGGDIGENGSAGTGTTGGVAGKAIEYNGNSVTYNDSGTTYGATS